MTEMSKRPQKKIWGNENAVSSRTWKIFHRVQKYLVRHEFLLRAFLSDLCQCSISLILWRRIRRQEGWIFYSKEIFRKYSSLQRFSSLLIYNQWNNRSWNIFSYEHFFFPYFSGLVYDAIIFSRHAFLSHSHVLQFRACPQFR